MNAMTSSFSHESCMHFWHFNIFQVIFAKFYKCFDSNDPNIYTLYDIYMYIHIDLYQYPRGRINTYIIKYIYTHTLFRNFLPDRYYRRLLEFEVRKIIPWRSNACTHTQHCVYIKYCGSILYSGNDPLVWVFGHIYLVVLFVSFHLRLTVPLFV